MMLESANSFHKKTMAAISKAQTNFEQFPKDFIAIATSRMGMGLGKEKVQVFKGMFLEIQKTYEAELSSNLEFLITHYQEGNADDSNNIILRNFIKFISLIGSFSCFDQSFNDLVLHDRHRIMVKNVFQNMETIVGNAEIIKEMMPRQNRKLFSLIKKTKREFMARRVCFHITQLRGKISANDVFKLTPPEEQDLQKLIIELNLSVDYLLKFKNVGHLTNNFLPVLKQAQLNLYGLIFAYYKGKVLPFNLNALTLISEFDYEPVLSVALLLMYKSLGDYLLEENLITEALLSYSRAFEVFSLSGNKENNAFLERHHVTPLRHTLKTFFEQKIDWQNDSFTSLLSFFRTLQSFKRNYNIISDESFAGIEAKVSVAQKVHWKAFNAILKRLKPGNITFEKVTSSQALAVKFNGDFFANRLFLHELKALLKANNIKLDYEITEDPPCLITSNLYDYPLEIIDGFVDCFIEAKQRFDFNNSKPPASQNTSTINKENNSSIKETSEVFQPSLPSVALPAISAHLYRRALSDKKTKVKTRGTALLTETNDNDEIPTPSTVQLGFSRQFNNLAIRPVEMMMSLTNKFYVCMSQEASLKKDACPLEIRQRFARLFESPRQCAYKGQQGFKTMSLPNGQVTLVAKILSSTGGNFRMYPALVEINQKGETLLHYDFVVKKGSQTAQNHEIESVSNDNDVFSANNCASSSTTLGLTKKQ